MKKLSLCTAIAVSLAFSGGAFATTLLDPIINNGSFEDITGGAGATITGTGPELPAASGLMGDRFAALSSGTGTNPVITIPGWTLSSDTLGTNVFYGVNFSGSTQSNDGNNNVVTNEDGILNGLSDEIPLDPTAGDLFNYSAAFHWTQGSPAPSYSLSYEFTDGAGTVIDTEVIAADVTASGPPLLDAGVQTTPYNDELSGSFSYTGAGTHVRVSFNLTTPLGGGTQAVADNFTLVQIPEPASFGLGLVSLFGLAGLRRR